jgi:hypothetical protein
MIKERMVTNFFIKCHLCNKDTPYYGYSFPAIFKPTKERVLLCDVCIEVIRKNKSDYREIKQNNGKI